MTASGFDVPEAEAINRIAAGLDTFVRAELPSGHDAHPICSTVPARATTTTAATRPPSST